MTETGLGIDVGGRVIILGDLQAELISGGVPVPNGLTIAGPPFPPPDWSKPPVLYPPYPAGSRLFTYDDQGKAIDLPPEAQPIVEAYTPSIPPQSLARQHIAAAQDLDALKAALLEALA